MRTRVVAAVRSLAQPLAGDRPSGPCVWRRWLGGGHGGRLGRDRDTGRGVVSSRLRVSPLSSFPIRRASSASLMPATDDVNGADAGSPRTTSSVDVDALLDEMEADACGRGGVSNFRREEAASPPANPTSVDRLYLDCPYADKDEAKALGARYDPDRREWYAPDAANTSAFARWIPGSAGHDDSVSPVSSQWAGVNGNVDTIAAKALPLPPRLTAFDGVQNGWDSALASEVVEHGCTSTAPLRVVPRRGRSASLTQQDREGTGWHVRGSDTETAAADDDLTTTHVVGGYSAGSPPLPRSDGMPSHKPYSSSGSGSGSGSGTGRGLNSVPPRAPAAVTHAVPSGGEDNTAEEAGKENKNANEGEGALPYRLPLTPEQIMSDKDREYVDSITRVSNATEAAEVLEILEGIRRLGEEGRVDGLGNAPIFGCDTEVCDLNLKKEGPVGHGFVTCATIYCGFEHELGLGPHRRIWIDNLDDAEGTLDLFKSFFEDPEYRKVWHNYSFDRHVMMNMDIDCQGFFGDTMHMARLLDTSRVGTGKGYSLESLSQSYIRDEKGETMPKTAMMKVRRWGREDDGERTGAAATCVGYT